MRTVPLHMLWVKGNLSDLELICINSFIHNGYKPNLWTYGKIKNVPSGCYIRNGREILPESRLFLFANSYAAFSDIFRYHILKKIGGLWADTDVVCLKNISSLPLDSFIVTERARPRGWLRRFLKIAPCWQVNGNIIYNKNPKDKNIIDLALAVAESFPIEKLKWGSIGPSLLHLINSLYPYLSFELKSINFANPISARDCPERLIKPFEEIPEDTFFLHLYNERWRRFNASKNAPFPENSIMSNLEKKYLK